MNPNDEPQPLSLWIVAVLAALSGTVGFFSRQSLVPVGRRLARSGISDHSSNRRGSDR
jgi:hypothetical protein